MTPLLVSEKIIEESAFRFIFTGNLNIVELKFSLRRLKSCRRTSKPYSLQVSGYRKRNLEWKEFCLKHSFYTRSFMRRILYSSTNTIIIIIICKVQRSALLYNSILVL